ncbi:MAG TPA: hypothetical protein VKR38_01745 [Usitatibacter sp.]|nr:hypothetical protein [Usitatibacter sp.]
MSISALKSVQLAVAFAGVVVAAGCAMMDTRPHEVVVKERAEARLKAVLAGDTRSMYEFFSPAVRKTLKYDDYASSVNKGFWKAATVEKVECPKADVCNVGLSVEYVYKGAKVQSPLSETWIQEGRDWWYAVKG